MAATVSRLLPRAGGDAASATTENASEGGIRTAISDQLSALSLFLSG
jgi:hypothetical protein